MKYAKLTNVSSARRAYSGLRDGSGRPLALDPKETKGVHPAVVSNPYVKADIEAGVLVVAMPGEEAAPVVKKAVAPAPEPKKVEAPPVIIPPVITPPVPPAEEEVSESEEEVTEEVDNSALRELFLEAPGITEKNVDAVLDAFTSVQELADAEESDLVAAGVSKSFTGRVLEWAIEQL